MRLPGSQEAEGEVFVFVFVVIFDLLRCNLHIVKSILFVYSFVRFEKPISPRLRAGC